MPVIPSSCFIFLLVNLADVQALVLESCTTAVHVVRLYKRPVHGDCHWHGLVPVTVDTPANKW